MCLLIVNSEGKTLPRSVILNAADGNPHGYGRLCLETGKVERTMDMKEAVKMALLPGPAIHHFRFATVGARCVDNAHPADIKPGWYLFQNGTVNGFSDRVRTDTQSMAALLKLAPEKSWPEILGRFDSRFAFVNAETKEVTLTGEGWVKRDDVWYSNGYHFDADNLVAVYGTLKAGHNNEHFLAGCKFVGWGNTAEKHRLCVSGGRARLPHLIQGGKDGKHVEVEVYEVSDRVLGALDLLESHPHGYERRTVDIALDGGKQVRAWVYFAPEARDTGEYLECYGQSWVDFLGENDEDDPSGLICPECGSQEVTEYDGFICCDTCFHFTTDGLEHLWLDGPTDDVSNDAEGSLTEN